MESNEALAPIIIKKKKIIQGGGHHGGAWKVAYADFVTAMMAFFMLMWLLNATTEKQRKGIADYFNPTIPINRISGGGDGMFGGDSVFVDDALAYNGTGVANGIEPDQSAQDGATLEDLEKLITGTGGESTVADDVLEHIRTRVTDEGLIIEIFDLPDEPLFAPGTQRPTALMKQLSDILVDAFARVTNQVAINGHIRSFPVVWKSDPGWDVSSARANATHEILVASGLKPERVERVTGWSDRRLSEDDPFAVRNNRIEITLLRPVKLPDDD